MPTDENQKGKKVLTRVPYERVTDEPDSPVLTLPPEEAKALRRAYAEANVILEYGSGGSTMLAAAMPGKTIFSVESDVNWAASMAARFQKNPPQAHVVLHPVDIGPTGPWGKPVDHSGWKSYHHYPLSVWDRTDFQHPDLILIDGRFRVACFITAALRISKPVIVLWDDYSVRRAYQEVERVIRPAAMYGRMAKFELEPMKLSNLDLSWIMKQYTRIL